MLSMFVKLIASLILGVLLPWSGLQAATAAPQGDTFVAAVRNQPTSLDPAIGGDDPSLKFLVGAYEPLIRNRFGSLDEQRIEGVLAKSWEISSDGMRYTFHLRTGVKFHDGSMLDAESVRVSLERMKAINLGNAFVLSPVKEVKASDPATVQITLSAPFAPFLLALPAVYIVSARAVSEHAVNGDWAKAWLRDHEAGSGPYVLKSWQLGQEIDLQAFPEYWRGWAGSHAKTVILRNVAEAATQRLLIQSGDVDWADTVTLDDAAALRTDGKVNVQVAPTLGEYYLVMNTKRSPLTDVNVRKALIAAFPYDQVIKDVMRNLASPANGYLPPSFPQHDRAPAEKMDLARARELLTKAGYSSGGFTLTLIYFAPFDFQGQIAQLYAAKLQQLGITLKLEGLPWASLTKRMSDSDPSQQPDMSFVATDAAYGSPDAILYPTFYSKSTYVGHYTYSNPRVDAMLDAARQSLKSADRTRLYKDIQQQLRADAPAVPVMLDTAINVYSRRVKHVDLLPGNGFIIDYFSIQL